MNRSKHLPNLPMQLIREYSRPIGCRSDWRTCKRRESRLIRSELRTRLNQELLDPTPLAQPNLQVPYSRSLGIRPIHLIREFSKPVNSETWSTNWTRRGIHSPLDKYKNQIDILMLKTAKCFLLNADKRPDFYSRSKKEYLKYMKYHSGIGYDGTPYRGSTWDRIHDYSLLAKIEHFMKKYLNISDQYIHEFYVHRKNLNIHDTSHLYLIRIYIEQLKDRYAVTHDYPYFKGNSPENIRLFSPFEHGPLDLLIEILILWSKLKTDLTRMIPQPVLTTRKQQDDYKETVEHLLKRYEEELVSIRDKYIYSHNLIQKKILRKAEREGKTLDLSHAYLHRFEKSYMDEHQYLEVELSKHQITSICSKMRYSIRPIYYPHQEDTYLWKNDDSYEIKKDPYTRWIHNIPDLILEAVDCHVYMLDRLIQIRKSMLKLTRQDRPSSSKRKNLTLKGSESHKHTEKPKTRNAYGRIKNSNPTPIVIENI